MRGYGRRGNRGKRFVCICMAIAIAFGLTQGVLAKSKSNVIRVGFFAFDGYHNMDENGERSGYGYEFIQKILRYNDETASYVGYDKTWAEMQDMLEKGQIDLLTSAQKTPERETKFDFSKTIGTSAAILTVKEGNTKYSAQEYSTYNGMRVGVIEGNSRNERFKEFAKKKGFSYRFVTYDDMSKMQQDLQDGKKIDAIVTSNLRSTSHEWILDKFDAAPFYAMVKKGNKALLEKVNYAIEQMDSNDVSWKDELFTKYYAGDSGDAIALSSTEREYIKQLKQKNQKIKVIINPDRAPYSYLKDGKPTGMIPEIFEKIAKQTDLPYEYVICKTRAAYQKTKEEGNIDVALDSRTDLSGAEDNGYKLTDGYMDIAYSSLERSDFSDEVKTVAMLKLAYTSDKNVATFTNGKEVKYYNTLDDCVDAVLDKEVDACYMYEYAAQKYAVENVKGDLQATTVPKLRDTLSFAVKNTSDYRLLAILNKGVKSVKGEYVGNVITKNTNFSIGKLTLFQVLWRNPVLLILLVALIALILILIIYSSQRRKRQRSEEEKNKELERFIGYVCKANTDVLEVNFATGKAQKYQQQGGHIVQEELEYVNVDVNKYISQDNINQVMEAGEDTYFEYLADEERGECWYSVTMTPIPVDEKHPRNVVIFKRDIDEQKKKEEKTKQSLKDALETANQASASKGSFLSNMSHEIRTPLNAMIGYLTIAKDPDTTKEKEKQCIDNCEVASKHLLQIINDILDMSSIETGKLKIAHEDFDLKKEITDITTIFFQNARSKGVEFETFIDGLTREWVIGDQLRINQVLMNLLSNAVKFTAAGGNVQLKVQQKREDDKKVYIEFSITDTGIGMSEEYMKRIFTPFEQENAGTAKRFGGSGLGLSITHNLVKMMGGDIKVKSKQGEGTTFTVVMYFDKSKIHHDFKHANADYSHVRVLVVDDKKDECTYVKTMLKRCSVKSDFVTSGEAALRRIRGRMESEYAYDMCIIDWNMPEMNGCEVTKRIRTELGADMPIIIATAYDISEFQEEAREVGVNKIVAKPLFQSTVFDILVSTFGSYNPSAFTTGEKEKIDMTGVHILLAEDNAMNMDIAVTMLEKVGIRVDQAVDGQEAYDTFVHSNAGTYDLILMDVQMPILDGYEATKAIRASEHPEAKSIPIIAMTANAFAEDVAQALANGMNAHIAKPINYDKMYEVLKQYSHKK